MAQIMNSLLPNSDVFLKKVGKTTRPFRYDLNQIPYNYTVDVRNRFKGLDLDYFLCNLVNLHLFTEFIDLFLYGRVVVTGFRQFLLTLITV